MRPLKILMTNAHSGAQTGSGMQLYLLARELVKRGHTVTAGHVDRTACYIWPAACLVDLCPTGHRSGYGSASSVERTQPPI